MQLQAVIFDLGRVLVNVDFSRGLFPLLLQREQSDEAPGTRLAREELFSAFGTGKLTPEQFHQRMCAAFGLDLPFVEFVRQWCDVFSPMPGMDGLLAEVAACLPIGLLSDTDPLHWGFCLENYASLRHIPKPTLSFRTGVLKPDPRAYRAAAADVGAPPEGCLFVDVIAANVEGARAIGMRAEVFTGADALRRTLVAILPLQPGQPI